MINRLATEEVTGGKARVSRADDDRGGALDDPALSACRGPRAGEPLCGRSSDLDRDVRRVRQGIEHGGALLRLGDQRLNVLP